jgi:hypothetical protein
MHRLHSTRHAEAYLERGRSAWVWVVPTCPYCGQAHAHYAGPLDSDPTHYLGPTVLALCPKTAWRTGEPGQPAVRAAYVLDARMIALSPIH